MMNYSKVYINKILLLPDLQGLELLFFYTEKLAIAAICLKAEKKIIIKYHSQFCNYLCDNRNTQQKCNINLAAADHRSL